MKTLALAGALALALVGCTSTGQLTPAAQADVQTALNTTCPLAAALQPSVVASFNGNVKTAYNAVMLACPPNPPPTNPVVIGVDVLNAITLLQPYLKNVRL